MKKTLTFLPVALCAALALTFSACSSDSDDEGGSVAEKWQGEYIQKSTFGNTKYTLEAKTLKKDTVIFDKLETKGGGKTTSANGASTCEWDYFYSNGKKVGAIGLIESTVQPNSGTYFDPYYFILTGIGTWNSSYYDTYFSSGYCNVADFDYSDISSETPAVSATSLEKSE